MADALPTLTSISEALDSLGLAMCVFDDADEHLGQAVQEYRVNRTVHAVSLAERILESIRAEMDVESQRVRVGASIGIAMCCSPDLDPDTLMRHADVAMYEAKASGSNRVKVSTTCC